MQFKQGTNVYTSDGKDVGAIDRVVLNPNTKEVTHVVVRKGFLFTEDKIVPLSLIASTTEDEVRLRGAADDLESLSPFEETHFLPLDESETSTAAYPAGWATPVYWYPPVGDSMAYANYESASNFPYRSETSQNIPQGTVALKEGARVVAADGEHVGSVKRVYTSAHTDQVTHLLIAEGLIFKDHKLVPVSWIRDIQENEIQLNVGADMLNALPEFQQP